MGVVNYYRPTGACNESLAKLSSSHPIHQRIRSTLQCPVFNASHFNASMIIRQNSKINGRPVGIKICIHNCNKRGWLSSGLVANDSLKH